MIFQDLTLMYTIIHSENLKTFLINYNPADRDVFKTSSGRFKKVATSYDQTRSLIYDVLKTSDLRRLEDV